MVLLLPAGPEGPCGPVAPCGPRGPAGPWGPNMEVATLTTGAGEGAGGKEVGCAT